ncbi:MAG: fumarylacetoacetate hydrolase family protein [Gammaproteobacteria bacterium]|nr:fumarylacetoacetate hydrolase family protein [Gammaproteobacteria bacterium]
MKLLTIDCREVSGRPGVMLDSAEILDLVAAPSTLSESQWIPQSVVSVLAAGEDGLERIGRLMASARRTVGIDRERLKTEGVLLPYNTTALMAPVRRPGLILVIATDSPAYIKSPNTAVGSDASVAIPSSIEENLTCSGMLAAVIGRPFYQSGPDEAAAAVAGYTLLLDLSLPLPPATAPLTEWRRYWESKQFPGSCPIGPAIITKDELPNPTELSAAVRINDVVIGSGRLCGGRLGIGERLADLSAHYSFRPGDLVAMECSADDIGRPRTVNVGDEYTLALPDVMELAVTFT